MESLRGRGGFRGGRSFRGSYRGNHRGRGGQRGRGGKNFVYNPSSQDSDIRQTTNDEIDASDILSQRNKVKVELPHHKTRNDFQGNNRTYHSQNNRQQSTNNNAYLSASISTMKDVFRELRDKLKPTLKNVDEKIFVQIDKFFKIVDLISTMPIDDKKMDAFFELCKVFTLPDLKTCKDANKKSSIYAIFFDGQKFKLSIMIQQIVLKILQSRSNEIFSNSNIDIMFDFFKVLIDVSSSNYDILKSDFALLESMTFILPDIKVRVDQINQHNALKEQNELNSFESAVSPTAEDLFKDKKGKINNHKNRVWSSFNEYKKAMIDLTKENFYTPFRKSLDDLKNQTLDYRDLFLYQDVYIPFNSNIENYRVFKECNFFLSFKIRSPPNCKKKLTTPDWKHTEQLGNRSLLILSTSPDLLKVDAVCRSCAAARSLDIEQSNATIHFLNNGIVPVVLISGQIKENVKYYMFEPTSCWPAVQPILQRLLKMNELIFPRDFINKIIKLDFSNNNYPEDKKISTDVIMLDRPQRETRKLYEKMATEIWEFDRYSKEQMSNLLRVDHEQYKALRYALTHNLTLVNGAPGTGKTHFAREYLRVMNEISHPKPIVVVTFTNHALDSILEGVLQFIRPEHLIRWGGPMRSTNPRLIERKWKNAYLSRDIRNEKNEIVTKKQSLKNMYNIRQMAAQYTDAILKDPNNINIYRSIMKILNYFFKATEKMAAHYPIKLTHEEIKEYNRYLNNRDRKIRHIPLPTIDDAINCWLNGEDYVNERNKQIRETLEFNRGLILGEVYHNPYSNLKSDDDYYSDITEEDENANIKDNDDKKGKNEEKSNKKHRKIHSVSDDDDFDDDKQEENENKSNKKHRKSHSVSDDDDDDDDFSDTKKTEKENRNEEEEENKEEEEEIEDKIYNDEDVVEMARVSFDGTEIEENLPKKYVHDVLELNFSTLFTSPVENKKRPSELMIKYLKIISDPLTRMINQYEQELQKFEIEFNDRETIEAGRYLQKMKLIGMTSTVASVRKEALEIAGCEILIVEEAGELTESMLSCILPRTLKRMILIGDYQQLRPKVEHELTGEPCNYDISLFEKLVVSAKEQNASCLFTLSVQRRMHPQISELIRNVFYSSGNEQINDAESTNTLGIPYGIPHRVRFFMHNYEENKIATRSHVNIQEAKFCASLVPFFICRGYKPEDITIISLYKGQMFQIQREIDALFSKYQNNRGESQLFKPFGNIKYSRQIKVVVLDNFQGEENKVIIVSLTRSDKPGFVKNRNRALVTLSRAREMLVVLGNERVFGMSCKKNDQWKKISTVASQLSPFSMSKPDEQGIAVNKCGIHKPNSKDIPSFLQTPQQVYDYRFSFCKELCNFKLPCTHLCQLKCHCHSYPPGPNEHDDYYCPFPCLKRCENDHQCPRTCGECTHRGFCPPCHVKIHHTFPCGHEADIQCHLVTSGKAKCRAQCGKIIERCGHPCVLECGHSGKCNCKVKLEKQCENCRRMFKYFCGEENPKCPKSCNFILPCGHTCSSTCIQCIERGHHDINCNHQCEFIFPCGHKCPYKCYEKFPNHQHFICQQKVQLNHNFYGNHNQTNIQECSLPISCNEPCQHSCPICKKRCTRSCSELCIDRCGCRCRLQCQICGKRCRALTGEKCAIFCEHCLNVKEPPEKVGLVYVFHGNHFLPLDEAKEKVFAQYKSIVNGEGDLPVPITRLRCPIKGCNCRDPCILGSWLFDKYNKNIENILKQIRQQSQQYILVNRNSSSENQYDKIHWYKCESCGELFFIRFDNLENLTVKCPNCNMQKGEMFE